MSSKNEPSDQKATTTTTTNNNINNTEIDPAIIAEVKPTVIPTRGDSTKKSINNVNNNKEKEKREKSFNAPDVNATTPKNPNSDKNGKKYSIFLF